MSIVHFLFVVHFLPVHQPLDKVDVFSYTFVRMQRALQAPTEKMGVTLITQYYKITGYVHLPVKGRLIDYFNRLYGGSEKGSFVVITDAKVFSMKDEQLCHEAGFLIVNKQNIHLVLPEEGNAIGQQDS